MRSQWCREHIDEVAQNCDLAERTVQEVKQAAEFCVEHREFSRLPTAAIMVLIREKEPQVKEKAISLVQNLLIKETPTGGKVQKKITASDVKKICDEINAELLQDEIRKQPEKPKEKEPCNVYLKMDCDPAACEKSGKLLYCDCRKPKFNICPDYDKEENQCLAGIEGAQKCTIENHRRMGCNENHRGMRTEEAEPEPEAPREATRLIVKTLPNPIGSPHIPDHNVEVSITSGMWRAIHNAIVSGKITADEKRGLDTWQVGILRALEAGVEQL